MATISSQLIPSNSRTDCATMKLLLPKCSLYPTSYFMVILFDAIFHEIVAQSSMFTNLYAFFIKRAVIINNSGF